MDEPVLLRDVTIRVRTQHGQVAHLAFGLKARALCKRYPHSWIAPDWTPATGEMTLCRDCAKWQQNEGSRPALNIHRLREDKS